MKRTSFMQVFIVIFGVYFFLLHNSTFAQKKSEPLPLASHFSKEYKDDLKGLLERRYIRVLTTFNKTNFFLFEGSTYGFEFSLLKDYEKFLNKKIKRRDVKVVLEFIPVSRDQLIPKLVNGLGDIAAASLTITPNRLETVNFTDPYLSHIDEIIVANKGIKGLQTLDDLSGRRIFVRESSSYYRSLLSLNKIFLEKGIRPVQIEKVDENLETEDILELVNSGAIKITISDSHIATIWSKIFKDVQMIGHMKVRTGSRIAWMVRKNNPDLKESLNSFLKTHKKGTVLGNIYFNRYYKNTKWIKNPGTSQERKKLNTFKGLFQKYASQYGFDWMLIMALAYQESGLNNNRRSPTGAIGIMQVLPSTAADNNIGIRNVQLLENNIHAGIKYLAFLRDRYFSEGKMRDRDRVRFTLASYNAGPAKIKRVRKLALKMELDSNRWFRNAEMAALKLIGQETVRYVSNINKYYILFKFAFKDEEVRRREKERAKSN
ncbi:MAG: transporter substrate-binding domain-containing protein [Thermodesulfobacteriota bacterium]|nr:transporter substrate-binding domain-containing protein [Thermodesulfobacteriota bacterium]